jgi:glyoxylase-like metal-dependent hydrolase (beta-lactamase superfamily II)
MLQVKRFINELMTSNCYVVYDEETKRCIVIDPASEKSLEEILFIEEEGLTLDFIILTHEHTDHTWGVNAIKERFPKSKILCSENCNKYAKKASRAYFLFYYDDPDYKYVIEPGDVLIKEDEESLDWNGYNVRFIMTPGHSYGSMCIDLEGMLFTGDTIMPFPPYFNGRDSNEDDWKDSIRLIESKYNPDIMIYPGHGDRLTLEEWKKTK